MHKKKIKLLEKPFTLNHLETEYLHYFFQDHPSFSRFLDLLWDKGYALCYKEKFNVAYLSGSSVLNLMRADMPGSEAYREYRQRVDLCTHTGEADCKCAETALDFLGSEWGAPPHLLPQPQEGPLQA